MASDIILDPLNPEQLQAVTYTGRHLLVFAGPGTGKTRVITHRIAHLIGKHGLDPESMLAITFTNKAAQEMKNRMGALLCGLHAPQTRAANPWVGTFHAFAHWLLRRHAKEAQLAPNFVIYDSDDQKSLLRSILNEEEMPPNRAGVFLEAIQRLKDDLMDAHSYCIHAGVSNDPYRTTIAKIYTAYQECLTKQGALDFGDLIMSAVNLLRQAPALSRLYQDKFTYIFIDEYQDINYAQYVLVRNLIGPSNNLTVVADDDQCIYEWRQANPKYTLEFTKEFTGADSITLTRNYRSTPEIIAAAAALIEKNACRKKKDLMAVRPSHNKTPQVVKAEDEKEEARLVAQKIKSLLAAGLPAGQVAVFYRTNAQSRNFEIELRQAGIPYRIIGAVGFYARREIKDMTAFARLLANPKDEISLWRVLGNFPAFLLTAQARDNVKELARRVTGGNAWQALELAVSANPQGFSAKAKAKISKFLSVYNVIRSQNHTAPDQVLELIAHQTGYVDGVEEDRALNIWEFIDSAREFLQNHPQADLTEFLSQTSLLASMAADNNHGPQGQDSVSLMTAHLAKGLEFSAVFLTGLEEGLFPFKISKNNPSELEEERRLFYVGLTRAKDMLLLSYTARRMLFGSANENTPSRFLHEAGLLDGAWEYKPILKRGSRVKHPLFGEGRILTTSGNGDNMKITVAFQKGGTRKFLAKMAPLEPL